VIISELGRFAGLIGSRAAAADLNAIPAGARSPRPQIISWTGSDGRILAGTGSAR